MPDSVVSGLIPSATTPAWFVHPEFAAAAVGLAAIPLLIHLWNRRRHRPVVWAAMAFLLAAHRRSRRRLRLEQFLLLALRCLIVLFICLAAARPFAEDSAARSLAAARQHHVLVMDNSYSTSAAAERDGRVFDALLAQSRKLIGSFPPADAVSLIATAHPARVVEVETIDRPRTLQALEGIESSFGGSDLLSGLALAERLAGQSRTSPGRCQVYVLTDATRAAWTEDSDEEGAGAAGPLVRRLCRSARVHIVRTPAGRWDNLAVTDLSPVSRLLARGLPCGIRAEVANLGRQLVSDARLRLLHEGQLVREVPIPKLDPGRRQRIEFELGLDGLGDHLLQVALSADAEEALKEDNWRLLAARVADAARVLLVEGRPAVDRFSGQCGYLSAALAPAADRDERWPVRTRIVAAAELPVEPLDGYGLIALCNVRQLSPEEWQRLRQVVADGAALLVFLGDFVNPEDYNRHAPDLMPARLAAIAGRPDDRDSSVRLSAAGISHPVAAPFSAEPDCSLFRARIRRYYRVERDDQAAEVRDVLRYENGDPAFIERRVGRGLVILCTTTANMDWTDLPAKGDFVSLLWDMLAYAWPSGEREQNVVVGQPLVQVLSAGQSDQTPEVAQPDGQRAVAEVRPSKSGFAGVFAETRLPGEHVMIVGQDRYRFAVNLDPRESDLAPLGEEALRRMLQSDCHYWEDVESLIRSGPASSVSEFSRMILYLLFAALLVETFLSMRFGHHR